MPIKVLVVDDEKDIVELVCYHLERAGVRCLQAADGSTAFRLIREHRPDLLILDLMLPGMDGLEIWRQLRRDPATVRLPTIMLTARAEEVDRVVGLEVGADDYVVKPFSPRELVARVKAILRRAQEPTGPSVRRVGELELDEARHQVRVKDALVGLTAKEFGLLCALIRAKGRVLNREQLLPALVILHEVAADVSAIFASQATQKNLALLNHVPPGLLVQADRDRLTQILVNLLDNAVKYTPEGGQVIMSAGRSGDFVEVSVRDTGSGIPSTDLPRITERFYRVDKARSRELGGTGLGLAIVKHLVQAHGGELRIESELGRGTTVRFTLPQA